MKSEEANKIIAEFMGTGVWVPVDNDCGELETLYSWSLDALVPVWEKLDKKPICISQGINQCEGKWFVQYGLFDGGERETIQEAAAIATAKAIQEMGK